MLFATKLVSASYPVLKTFWTPYVIEVPAEQRQGKLVEVVCLAFAVRFESCKCGVVLMGCCKYCSESAHVLHYSNNTALEAGLRSHGVQRAVGISFTYSSG